MKFNIKKQIGARIKQVRQQKGLSQEQFAKKLGIATRTLCGIEIGKNFFLFSIYIKPYTYYKRSLFSYIFNG